MPEQRCTELGVQILNINHRIRNLTGYVPLLQQFYKLLPGQFHQSFNLFFCALKILNAEGIDCNLLDVQMFTPT